MPCRAARCGRRGRVSSRTAITLWGRQVFIPVSLSSLLSTDPRCTERIDAALIHPEPVLARVRASSP